MKIYRLGLSYYVEDGNGVTKSTHIHKVYQKITTDDKLTVNFADGSVFYSSNILEIETQTGSPIGANRTEALTYLIDAQQNTTQTP